MINIFNSLKRIKTLMFLIIIQLALGLAMLNSSTAIIEETSAKKEGFEKIFDSERTYAMRMNIKIDKEDYDLEGYNRINDLYPQIVDLKKSNILESCKIIFPLMINIEGIDNHIPEKYMDVQGLNSNTAKVIVNSDLIEEYQINIVDGRNLKQNDFEWAGTGNIPILIGSGYKDVVKVGEVFNCNLPKIGKSGEVIDYECKFEVVGIMDRNPIPVIFAKERFFENVEYSDYTVVIPTNNELLHLSTGIAIADQCAFVTSNNIEKLQAEMNKISGDRFDTSFIYLKDDYDGAMELLNSEVVNSVILGFALTFLSVIGITAVLIGELKKRRKELGMKLSCGATIGNLCREMVGEILIMLSISAILSILLMFVWNSGGQSVITPILVLVNIGAVIILTTLISIIPVVSIRKMNIVDLVRGK